MTSTSTIKGLNIISNVCGVLYYVFGILGALALVLLAIIGIAQGEGSLVFTSLLTIPITGIFLLNIWLTDLFISSVRVIVESESKALKILNVQHPDIN